LGSRPHRAPSRTLAVESVGLAGFETFVPRIRVKVGAQWRTTPLFGTYFFVRVVDRWRILEATMGVLNVVKFGTAPAHCPDEEIAALIEKADRDGIIRLGPRPLSQPIRRSFAPGTAVAVTAGPLAGFEAIHTGMSAHERELVLIELLGGPRRVEISSGLLAQR
jgi:transcription antitermination factor NusG